MSISGVGEDGPYAAKRVYDPLIQALSGLADIQADPTTGRPRMTRTIVADKATAVYQGFSPLTPDDVADAITYAVSRPAHVNVGEIVMWPTDQASTTIVRRD